MKRKLFSFSASVITAIMLTACAAAPENKPASSAALSPTSEAVATAIPSTSNANWKLPPQYDFDEMIPLFSRETHTAGYAAARNLYAVRKGERWSLFNAANCNAFLEDLSESIPYLYGEQELSIGVDDTYDYQKLNALEEQINQELVAQQMPFTTMLGGHGGYGIQWILGDSQIYRSAIVARPSNRCMLLIWLASSKAFGMMNMPVILLTILHLLPLRIKTVQF